jgi:hypothetical protein
MNTPLKVVHSSTMRENPYFQRYPLPVAYYTLVSRNMAKVSLFDVVYKIEYFFLPP